MSGIENWIRLARLESPRRATMLVEHFGSPEGAFQASDREFMDVDGLSKRFVEKLREAARQTVENDLRALEACGARVVTFRDEEYPANLRDIYDPPAVLFVRGRLEESDRLAVGVIGTRRPSEYGRAVTLKIARELAMRGICVISGAARGIDTAAHNAVLQAGGRTVAVLGCGVDVPYPYENRGLLQRIAQTGAVISEFVPGSKPDAWRFPVRNRIVSGMSRGVLVVESKVTGGAMITATLAAEQGRDVWAVPGGTDSYTSEGPHRLIKEGAKLVERVEDILEELGIEMGDAPPTPQPVLTPEQQTIMDVLSLHPKHADDIVAECGLRAAEVSSNLTLLEMQGLVRRVPGNSYVRSAR